MSFMGPEKSGKSFLLQDMAWRAAEQGRNVAYFEVGDSTEPEVLQRFIARACGRPIRAYKHPRRWAIDQVRYEVPTKMETSGGRDLPKLETDRRRHQRDLTEEQLDRALDDVNARMAGRFKLSCHPSSTVSVRRIESILESWERGGWLADVVVIDYADILEPMDRKYDKRDQVNETWLALRGLSQKKSCLVVTATQTDSDSYDTWLLTRENFSEDKRKFAHVTAMIGNNQTDREKEIGVRRFNWVGGVSRNMDVLGSQYLWVAGCLAISQPVMLSSF